MLDCIVLWSNQAFWEFLAHGAKPASIQAEAMLLETLEDQAFDGFFRFWKFLYLYI